MNKILNSFLALGLSLLCQPLFAGADSEQLASVLAAQPEETQARYPYRHPQETLAFFGIEPGMTVVEAPARWRLVTQKSCCLTWAVTAN